MADTNVVIDVLEGEGVWRRWSAEALVSALNAGPAAVSAIVAGELATRFATASLAIEALGDFGLQVLDLTVRAAHAAGSAQAAYRAVGGRREHLLGDFLIGAHAVATGATLITRDARYYRRYFPDLPLITPETHP